MEEKVVIFVPSKKQYIISYEGKNRTFRVAKKVIEWFEKFAEREVTVLAIMGGPGQSILIRISQQFRIPVKRVPFYRLQEVANLPTNAPPEERISVIEKVWKEKPEYFYLMPEYERELATLRILCRVRGSIQRVYRIPAQLQYKAAWRELSILAPEEKELLELQTYFARPQHIAMMQQYENELEDRIAKLLKDHPLYHWMHPPDGSLPDIKGFGPSIAGTFISEVGDIKRFRTSRDLKAYAHYHLTKEGKFPKRKRGEVANWNKYLERAIWFWTDDQVPRYDSPWRNVYYWKKAKVMQEHPEVIKREVVDRHGILKTIYDYSLAHIDAMAKRYVGGNLLEYLFQLWKIIDGGGNPKSWYLSSKWPKFFGKVNEELKAGLLDYLNSEIPKRRKKEPEKPEEEEEFF